MATLVDGRLPLGAAGLLVDRFLRTRCMLSFVLMTLGMQSLFHHWTEGEIGFRTKRLRPSWVAMPRLDGIRYIGEVES